MLELFRDGTPLSELPELAAKVSELAFAPLIERPQEGEHAPVKKATHFRKVTGAHVSFPVRSGHILSLMQQEDHRSRFFNLWKV